MRFTVPGRTIEVPCYPNLNLLAHAQLEELDIGSECGGHGRCGGDRIRVEAPPGALSPVTSIERKHLSPAELTLGIRLGCQCFPETASAKIEVSLAGR